LTWARIRQQARRGGSGSGSEGCLQFLLGLPDRDAAEAVRCRIDFKCTLGLELDDPGFHHSVLGDFRDRLLEDGREILKS
jgi:IS5 family transposase